MRNFSSLSQPMRGRHAQRGFTILEMLIAVIIISILVAIIIPVLSNRANDARIAAAQSDLDSIMNAQQHAAIDTGYFYRLYVLDDTGGADGISPELNTDVVDGIKDEFLRVLVPNPTQIFIDTVNGGLLVNHTDKYNLLTLNETSFNWRGPYINVAKKVKPAPDNANQLPGLPLDPWGQPYLLFTKLGMVEERPGQPGQGTIVTAAAFGTVVAQNCVAFDRPTVLSLGPNGLPGDGTNTIPAGQFGQGDDMLRQF